jgi:hypothetical protein
MGQQPIFIAPRPAPTAQSQGPLKSSSDLNQAAMSQIINQLNQRQLQLNIATAQASAQRRVFVPQVITVRRAK